MAVPPQILAGTTVAWAIPAPQSADGSVIYRASEGWELVYVLQGPASITVTAEADGDGYAVAVTAEDSAEWAAGWYTWTAFVSKDAERYRVGSGSLRVMADPALAAAPADVRSHARKMLEALEAVLEGRASADVEEYTIAGRQLKKIPVAELLTLRDRYRAEVAREDRAAAGKARAQLIRPGNLGRRF